MQVFIDHQKNIFTDQAYADEQSQLKSVFIEKIKEFEDFHVDHEDFVASVPGSMTLKELDDNLKSFDMFANILAPANYNISKIISEFQDKELLKKVLGLNLLHIDETLTKAGAKVIKDVSGYDMKKLYIGSFNSLAMIYNVFLRLEKRFSKKLIFEFKMAKDLDEVYYLRNFLQSFLDSRIVFKLNYSKLFGDFKVKISTSASDKILEYRKKAISDFLDANISSTAIININEQRFSPVYKVEKRMELDFNFTDLKEILEVTDSDLVIEPLRSLITINDYKGLGQLVDHCFNLRLFPVNQVSRKVIKELLADDKEYQVLIKLKEIFDKDCELNPGIL